MKNLFLKISELGRGLIAAWRNESGQDLVEYILVISVLSLAATAALKVVATALTNSFDKIANAVNSYL